MLLYKLSKEALQKALDENEGSLKKTAAFLNVKYSILVYNVKKHNLVFKNLKKPLPIHRLKELYEKHKCLSGVAKELGVTKEGVRLAMKRHNMPINPLVKYSFDEDFWSRENEESFYWAGFWAADGCVMYHSKKYKCASIGLSIKDKLHLEKFKKAIKADHPIKVYKVKAVRNGSSKLKCEMRLFSDKFFDDLAKFNVVPRKTKIYEFPKWLLNHKLLSHFMRGYFDGDGSLYFGASKKTPQLYFSLAGNTWFLKIYRDILERECDIHKRTKDIRVNKIGLGILEYGGNNIVTKITKYLYQNSSISLDRKRYLAISSSILSAASNYKDKNIFNIYFEDDLKKSNFITLTPDIFSKCYDIKKKYDF